MLDLCHSKTDFVFKYHSDVVAQADDLLFIFKQADILTYTDKILTFSDVVSNISCCDSLIGESILCFGMIKERKCFCLKDQIPEDCYVLFDKLTLKTSHSCFSQSQYYAAILANHLSHWLLGHKYCGSCGARTKVGVNELSLICTNSDCNAISYPTIAPVVMGIIRRGNEILLAKHKYSVQNIYACLAGFVSPGETLEAALMREVNEEVGLQIEGLKYIASQPWPFPNSLIMGFSARYLSGEIKIDYNELEHAAWYDVRRVHDLPILPAQMSLSRYLIDMQLESDSELI